MIKIDCLVSGVFFVRDHWVPYKKARRWSRGTPDRHQI